MREMGMFHVPSQTTIQVTVLCSEPRHWPRSAPNRNTSPCPYRNTHLNVSNCCMIRYVFHLLHLGITPLELVEFISWSLPTYRPTGGTV